jgi:hypothetical protein
MATRISSPQPRLDAPIVSLLARLRRRIRAYVWTDGLAAALAALAIGFWLSLAFDWLLEPPRALRALALAAMAVVLGWIVFRLLIARALVPLNNRNMAVLLERRFGQFRDSLLTAVELAEEPEHATGFNPVMLATTHREAMERARHVDIRAVFNPAPLARRVSAAVVLVLATAAFAVLAPQAMAVWARRSLLLADELWPRKTRLVVDGLDADGHIKVARGSDWRLDVRADAAIGRAIPEVVEVRYTTEEGGRGRDNMSREGVVAPGEAPYQDYAYTFKSVLGPLAFHVLGGDDRLGPYYVDVVESPTVSRMTLRCEYPAYVHRETRNIQVSGLMPLPRGSHVTILAEANKPLVAVQVDDVADDRAPITARLDLAAEAGAPQTRFQFDVPELDGDKTLVFTLFDADGIRSRDAVRLVLGAIADEPPQVNVQLKGIGTAITPEARLPAAGEISDDYGVAKVWFEFQVDEKPPAQQAIVAAGTDRTKLAIADALETNSLELEPKQKLHWTVQAADECALESGANVGTSQRYVLDVVTPEQLRAMLEARELGLRRRFETILEELTGTRELLATLDPAPKSDAPAEKPAEPAVEPGDSPLDGAARSDARALEVHAERVVQNTERSAHETLQVAIAFDEIREEMINNRVDTEELKTRLKDGVADPLKRIVEERFAKLAEKLKQLTERLADPQAAALAKAESLAELDAILVEMRSVLDKMLELETFNEVLDMLRQIIDAQEKVNAETKQKQKQKLRDLTE